MYGIRRASGPGGVPLFVVWTRHRGEDNETFEELKASVIAYLRDDAGVSFDEGHLLDVYGPDGSLQHRLDARV